MASQLTRARQACLTSLSRLRSARRKNEPKSAPFDGLAPYLACVVELDVHEWVLEVRAVVENRKYDVEKQKGETRPRNQELRPEQKGKGKGQGGEIRRRLEEEIGKGGEHEPNGEKARGKTAIGQRSKPPVIIHDWRTSQGPTRREHNRISLPSFLISRNSYGAS